jgi:hypothetical protein
MKKTLMNTAIMLTIMNAILCPAEDAAWEAAVKDPAAADLARPTPQQYEYQEQDRIMFVHFSLNTWTGKEYDLGGISPDLFNPTKLDTDQWCQAALNMGAKGIIFVAKHVGGFCLWQTETTDYSLKSAPWKDGQGDILRELSEIRPQSRRLHLPWRHALGGERVRRGEVCSPESDT